MWRKSFLDDMSSRYAPHPGWLFDLAIGSLSALHYRCIQSPYRKHEFRFYPFFYVFVCYQNFFHSVVLINNLTKTLGGANLPLKGFQVLKLRYLYSAKSFGISSIVLTMISSYIHQYVQYILNILNI